MLTTGILFMLEDRLAYIIERGLYIITRVQALLHRPVFYLYFTHKLPYIFYKLKHFCFSCSPYISLKLQLRFMHFTYSNLAVMNAGFKST